MDITQFPLLSFLIFMPLMGVLALLSLQGSDEQVGANARWVALWTSISVFFLALVALYRFDPTIEGFQFIEREPWFAPLNIHYFVGLDGISLPFVALTAFLVPICILASWESIQTRVKEFMMLFLLLETFMIGMFCALDLFLFYIFFEGVLIPMFFIMGMWGGERRIYASFKLVLYTLLGSVLMLVAFITMALEAGTSSIPDMTGYIFSSSVEPWLWLAMFASFAVKIPMWPVHTWLPDAHVEAPTAGSVILAGILLKMGGYGFLRLSIPLLPEMSQAFAPMMFGLSVVAIVYTSLVALVQEDMKKLIAYSSIAHMGFVTLGLFTLQPQAMNGAVFQMISHGLASAALFLCVGVVYDRAHTRQLKAFGGLSRLMPWYATFFMVFMLTSVGLPGTSGFVGEFLVLLGTFQISTYTALFAGTGVILGASYMLLLYRSVMFGKVSSEKEGVFSDLSLREKLIFAPLAVSVLFFGIYPTPITYLVEQGMNNLMLNKHARNDASALEETALNHLPPFPLKG